MDWFEWVRPTYNQTGSSCESHATANVYEMLIRRYVGKHSFKSWEQLDGDRLYAETRKLYYGPDDPAGLYPGDSLRAGIELGLFPPGTVVGEADPSSDLNALLRVTPLVQGHYVTDGWDPARMNPENGGLDESVPSSQNRGGHATVLIGELYQAGRWFRPLANSWGDTWGWHGVGLMSEEYWQATHMGGPLVYPLLPAGWPSYDGWRSWVIEVKER